MADEQVIQPMAVALSPAATGVRVAERRDWTTQHRMLDFAGRYAALGVLLALLIASTAVNHEFWTIANIRNVLNQNAPIALVSIGMTFVIISGMFDLSVGSEFAAGGVVFAKLYGTMPFALVVLATLAIGVVAGIINAVVITRLRVNPFIATIGTGAAFSGAVLIYSNSSPIEVANPSFQNLGLGSIGGIPWAVVLMIAVALVSTFVLSRLVYGRQIYAVGGGREAARLVGLRVSLIQGSTFIIVGVLAVLAGMVVASNLAVGQPTLGADVSLDSFAIVIIGGTSVWGGEGAIWRSVVGVLIIGVLTNMFDALAWPASLQDLATGCVLVGAVAIDALRHRRR